jgi:inorganic pyrophosphatase
MMWTDRSLTVTKPEAAKFHPSNFAGTLYGIDPGPDCPRVVRMIVEIPKNSSNKYEYDPIAKTFRLDRALYSPMHYPADYGFVPGTIAEDGDPLDVLCLIDHPTFTGCLIEVRPIGVLDLIDQTASDHKIIAVPLKDPRFEHIETIEDLSPHVTREFEHFFTIYKELENKVVETRGWLDLERALEIILADRKRYTEAVQQT